MDVRWQEDVAVTACAMEVLRSLTVAASLHGFRLENRKHTAAKTRYKVLKCAIES